MIDTHSPIDPAVYRLNPLFATYARTESAEHILIPFNRLALLDAVVNYLADEIEKNEKRLMEQPKGFSGLKSANRVVQPSLPDLLG